MALIGPGGRPVQSFPSGGTLATRREAAEQGAVMRDVPVRESSREAAG